MNYTRELLLYIDGTNQHEILDVYNRLAADDRPIFVEWVQTQYPSLFNDWLAYMAKRVILPNRGDAK